MFILKFDKSSEFSGQYVAIDDMSGGYPYAVGSNILRAKVWDTVEDALDYASHFAHDSAYRAHAIEPKAYPLTYTVGD